VSNKIEPDVVYPHGLVLNGDYEEEPYEGVCACVYHLTTTSYGSFVQYLLENKDGYLSFLEIEETSILGDFHALSGLLGARHRLTSLCFKGHICSRGTLYIFFQSRTSTSKPWVTIDEICNAKRYKMHPIAEAVTEFFLSNSSFLAPGSNGKPSEIPVIGSYVQPPQGAILGNVSYFVLGCPSGFAQRCAIFLAKCKVVSSLFDNDVDRSISSQLAELTEEVFDTQALKLVDCDGKWRSKYDSIIVGRIKLGSYTFADEPICGVKNPEQFICL
jgi:hypothetical protein